MDGCNVAFFEETLDRIHGFFKTRDLNLIGDIFLLIKDFNWLFSLWIVNLKNAVGPLPKQGLAKFEEVCSDDKVEEDEKKSAKDVAEDQWYPLMRAVVI